MRNRVVPHNVQPPVRVDLRDGAVGDLDEAGGHGADVEEATGVVVLSVMHLEPAALSRDRAGIANLSTGLRVERRLVQDDHRIHPLVNPRVPLSGYQERGYLSIT